MLSTNLSRRGVSANTVSSRSRTQLQIVCLAPETRKIKGLKYDGSNLRWVRDERYGSMNSYTVQPKTGIAYTVWPVVHTVLTEKKLKRVTVEEAHNSRSVAAPSPHTVWARARACQRPRVTSVSTPSRPQAPSRQSVNLGVDVNGLALSCMAPPTVHCAKHGASAMSTKGWTLVDVRAARDYELEHAEGAVNVPLYRPVAGNEFWDVLKRVAMAGFAMQATERNPDFVEVALEKLRKNEKIIIMCNIGGTLETLFKPSSHKKGINDPDRAFGRESRSLKAAYEIIEVSARGPRWGTPLPPLNPPPSPSLLPAACSRRAGNSSDPLRLGTRPLHGGRRGQWAAPGDPMEAPGPRRATRIPHAWVVAGGWNASNVVFVEGGVQMWRHRGFPVV
ncbi:MAG: hypothetical protein WDW36_007066 [Sanguina aurantia]